MEQNIRTLNLPKTKLNKLLSLGINYCCELTESHLNSLSINLPELPPTINALDELEAELLDGAVLSFNSDLDEVLKDEITPKRITEFAGFPGSGKTQICFQLCITTQLPKSLGGLEGQVVYISTDKSFAAHRLRELAGKLLMQISKAEPNRIGHMTEDMILKNIIVFDSSSFAEICATIKYLELFLKGQNVKLLIMDSIASPLKDMDPKDRLPLLYKLLEDLQHLAAIFNFAIVVTNDFTTSIKDNKPYHTPSLGNSFFDRINSRICLSRTQVNNVYIAELVKSTVKAPRKIHFGMF